LHKTIIKMEYNLNIYNVGVRYVLCAICGVVGGLLYASNAFIGIPILILSVIFFLEGILAFDPIYYFLKKNTSKDVVDDFK